MDHKSEKERVSLSKYGIKICSNHQREFFLRRSENPTGLFTEYTRRKFLGLKSTTGEAESEEKLELFLKDLTKMESFDRYIEGKENHLNTHLPNNPDRYFWRNIVQKVRLGLEDITLFLTLSNSYTIKKIKTDNSLNKDAHTYVRKRVGGSVESDLNRWEELVKALFPTLPKGLGYYDDDVGEIAGIFIKYAMKYLQLKPMDTVRSKLLIDTLDVVDNITNPKYNNYSLSSDEKLAERYIDEI